MVKMKLVCVGNGMVGQRFLEELRVRLDAVRDALGLQQVLEVGGKDTLQKALTTLGPGGHIALIGGLGTALGPLLAAAIRNSAWSTSSWCNPSATPS